MYFIPLNKVLRVIHDCENDCLNCIEFVMGICINSLNLILLVIIYCVSISIEHTYIIRKHPSPFWCLFLFIPIELKDWTANTSD